MRPALALAACALLALASCASSAKASSATGPAASADTFGLPPVRGPLEFAPDAREVSLGWLVDELARLSGQELTMAVDLRRALDGTMEPLEQRSPVPAGEVYAFVEALLTTQGIVIAPAKGGARPVLGVYGGQGARLGEPVPVQIEPARVAALAGHPALLCQVLLDFENIDSRQLQTQLRQLLVEASGLQQIVPAGERSLILQASGAKLLALVPLLQEVDRLSEQRERPPATPAQAAKAPTVPRMQ